MLMTDCPTEETLAAFIDDRLDAPTRRKVTEHVAGCGECRELVNMATDFEMSETPANVARGKFGWSGAAAALAAAAVIAVFALRPAFLFRPDIEDVVAASRSLDYRPSVGQFATEFPYQEESPKTRGDGGDEEELPDVKLLNIAAEAKDPHVKGLALLHLSTSEREYYDDAIALLEASFKSAPPDEKDAITIDYAAALLSHWAKDEDRELALKLSTDVWNRTRRPKAAWNRAAALESLRRYPEAFKAWEEYGALDASSKWAQEADRRKEDLKLFLDDIK
jgi:hypothetical protein